MKNSQSIHHQVSDPSINIALDTLKKQKQAIFFVNSKRGAESLAEKISIAIKTNNTKLQELSKEAMEALAKPTKQCRRLGICLRKGIAFHHAGLAPKQRELVEDGFRNGTISIICATPTLAFGLDLPAFRVIIRDLKRFGRRGMEYIPVLEYEQQCGRAGRPGKEEYGQAITIAQNEAEKEHIIDKYINGLPEEIYSKLAVEPVLRMYLLSLIASGFITNTKNMMEFFSKTFYAHQFEDLFALEQIIDRMLEKLKEWEFITFTKEDDFMRADELISETKTLAPTAIGRRVSELYVDPLSAHYLITQLQKSTLKSQLSTAFSYLFMITRCNELKPLLKVRMAEFDDMNEAFALKESELFEKEPVEYSHDFDDFMDAFKTSKFFEEWIEEKDEEYLLESYNIRPGEIKIKLDIADWLIYCSTEFSKMLGFKVQNKELHELRIRLKYGVKKELLALLKLKNIGRVRARKLHGNNIKTLGDIKKVNITTLAQLIGKKTAIDIKSQVGEEHDPAKVVVKPNKRKGQINLTDF